MKVKHLHDIWLKLSRHHRLPVMYLVLPGNDSRVCAPTKVHWWIEPKDLPHHSSPLVVFVLFLRIDSIITVVTGPYGGPPGLYTAYSAMIDVFYMNPHLWHWLVGHPISADVVQYCTVTTLQICTCTCKSLHTFVTCPVQLNYYLHIGSHLTRG